EIAVLMTQLAIAEACHVPHIFYDTESSLYQAAQARQATYEPPPMYPTYPTWESLIAYHGIETAQLAAHQVAQLGNCQTQYDAYQQRDHFSVADLGLDDHEDGVPFHMDQGGSSHS
ncbi:hypothetical protein A2U01_0055274, partial [Trifolium medium]|nr:hypothetical protein [Trifolium medium]